MKLNNFKTVEIGLSKIELQSFFERFGERYWNDNDDIIFIPISEFINNNSDLEHKFYTFFGNVDKSVEGIYININKSE